MTATATPADKPSRLLSLDALRGLDMLIIAGVDTLVYSLAHAAPGNGAVQGLREQMTHVDWEGLVAYDLVFPLFVFLAGVSMRLSHERRARAGTGALRNLWKMWSRAAILVVLGWAVNGVVTLDGGMRYASVLGLIGISGALAGTLSMALRRSAAACAAAAGCILLAVGLCQFMGGDFTMQGSFNAQVDQLLCPGRLYRPWFDPEGPFCILSATALCLAGYAVGRLLSLPLAPRLLWMGGAAAACIAASLPLPCIKNIWTPGFVLAAAGACTLLLALFHILLDVLPWRKWAYPLQVAGSNALFLYLLVALVPVQDVARRLSCGIWQGLPAEYLPTAYASTALLLAWLVVFFLYRRRVFIKI